MRSLALILAPFVLAGIAYATAQSLATHDWLTAGPLLILLAVGIALIATGEVIHHSGLNPFETADLEADQ